jgi:hypothetical protein
MLVVTNQVTVSPFLGARRKPNPFVQNIRELQNMGPIKPNYSHFEDPDRVMLSVPRGGRRLQNLVAR